MTKVKQVISSRRSFPSFSFHPQGTLYLFDGSDSLNPPLPSIFQAGQRSARKNFRWVLSLVLSYSTRIRERFPEMGFSQIPTKGEFCFLWPRFTTHLRPTPTPIVGAENKDPDIKKKKTRWNEGSIIPSFPLS